MLEGGAAEATDRSGHTDAVTGERQYSAAAFAGLARGARPKVSHLVAVQLRDMILTGELAANQRLPPESELATAFSVSKETLREALRILESQSLLEIRRGRGGGPVVRRPGIDAVSRHIALHLQRRQVTLTQLAEARAIFETPAAEQFATRATPIELAELVVRHDTEKARVSEPLAFAAAVAAFDQSVTELSGNRTLGVLAGAFREIHAGQVFQNVAAAESARSDDFPRGVVGSHAAFIDAAQRRDGGLANRVWHDYLLTTDSLAGDGNRRPALIDITPLWRAQLGSATGHGPHRRAAALVDEIRARIADGTLAEGTRLPALPELAIEFDVSRPTLREALRVLEMERLIDLPAGERGGAKVLTPSTLAAARLVGIALEGRGVTFADFYRAHRMIEPQIRRLAVERMRPSAVVALRHIEHELAASVGDSGAFVEAWHRSEVIVLSEIRNPAIALIGEITGLVAVEVERISTTDRGSRQWWDDLAVHALRFLREYLDAAEAGDGVRAGQVWTEYLAVNTPFFEGSEIADRPLTGLVDGGTLA